MYRMIEFDDFKLESNDGIPSLYYKNQLVTIKDFKKLIYEKYNVIETQNSDFINDNAFENLDYMNTFSYKNALVGDLHTFSSSDSMPSFKYITNVKNIIIKDDENYYIDDNILYDANSNKLLRCFKQDNIKIPSNIKSIGQYAFKGCNTKELIIPDTITNIDTHAFNGLPYLEKIKLSKNLETLAKRTISNCPNLINIDFNDNEKIMIYPGAIINLPKIKEIEFPKTVFSIENPIINCNSLEKVILPKKVYELNNVTFQNCFNIKEIIVEEKSPWKIKDNFLLDKNNIMILADLRKDKKVLEVPSGIEYISNDVINNPELKEIRLPSTFKMFMSSYYTRTLDKVSIDNNNIPNTIKTKTINFGKNVDDLDITNLQEIKNLEEIIVDPENEHFCSKDGVLFSKDMKTLFKFPEYKNVEEYVIPEGVENIYRYAFYGCNNIKKIKCNQSLIKISKEAFFSSSIKEIELNEGLENIEPNAFYFTELYKINIPSTLKYTGKNAFYKIENVICNLSLSKEMKGFLYQNLQLAQNINLNNDIYDGIEEELSQLSSLKSINIKNENFISENGILYSKDKTKLYVYPMDKEGETYIIPDSVLEINNISNSHLKAIKLPKNLTKIKDETFNYCRKLEEIIWNDKVKEIGSHAFSNCNFSNLIIPESVTNIGEYAFENCQKLEKIVLPKNIKKLNKGLFNNCNSLYDVTLPKNLTNISEEMFYKCKRLKNINIPENLKIIEKSAFYDCIRLSDINIEKVHKIHDFAFSNCSSLKYIKIPNMNCIKNFQNKFSYCKKIEEIDILEKYSKKFDLILKENFVELDDDLNINFLDQTKCISNFNKENDIEEIEEIEEIIEQEKDEFAYRDKIENEWHEYVDLCFPNEKPWKTLDDIIQEKKNETLNFSNYIIIDNKNELII